MGKVGRSGGGTTSGDETGATTSTAVTDGEDEAARAKGKKRDATGAVVEEPAAVKTSAPSLGAGSSSGGKTPKYGSKDEQIAALEKDLAVIHSNNNNFNIERDLEGERKRMQQTQKNRKTSHRTTGKHTRYCGREGSITKTA